MRENQAIFANFILKFGDRNLADYLNEIVLPAFIDQALERRRGTSRFKLIGTRTIDLDRELGEPAIIGRYVKDTLLRRTQVLAHEELVEDEAYLQSSPSAFFVLTLVDHRLIYFGETPYAPDVGSFQATMSRFLDRKYEAYIDKLYGQQGDNGRKLTKKALREIHHWPSLEIVPISHKDTVEEFVRRYATLKQVEITVHRRNDGVDFSELMETVSEYNELVGGNKTKVVTVDNEGLDQEGVIEALSDAGDGGNQTVKLSGIDHSGNKLVGDNEDFSVKVDLEDVPALPGWRARRLYRAMKELVESGALRAANITQAARQRIVGLAPRPR